MKSRDAFLAECRAMIDRQCAAHGVEQTPMVRGVLNNLLQFISSEWEEALGELSDALDEVEELRPVEDEDESVSTCGRCGAEYVGHCCHCEGCADAEPRVVEVK